MGNDLEKINEQAPPAGNDEKAKLEVAKLQGSHSRGERVQEHLTKASIAAIWGIGTVAFVAVSIRIIHLIVAPQYCWMNDTQVASFDKALGYITTGSVGAFIGSQFKKGEK